MGRARGACIGCRSNKQKCDSALQVPCRRCQVYKIDCTFAEGDGPPPTAARVSAVLPSQDSSSLDSVNTRLTRIEETLSSLTKLLTSGTVTVSSPASHPASSSSQHLTPTATATEEPPRSMSPKRGTELTTENNPLQILVSTMQEMDAITRSSQRRTPLSRKRGESFDSPHFVPPDVIDRSLLTSEQCERIFKVYWGRMNAWIPFVEEQSAMELRRKSSFLFHAILLTTGYFNKVTTPETERVYLGLTTIVNELVATNIVLSPHPSVINRDTIRALVLVAFYKPVQTASYVAKGFTDMATIVQQSKINPLSSITLQAILRALTRLTNFDSIPDTFLSLITSPNPPKTIPTETLYDLRLWVWIVAGDCHSSLQAGRECWTKLGPTCQITRSFAALSPSLIDNRQAAILELYSKVHCDSLKATTPSNLSPIQRRMEALPYINSHLEEWLNYWSPLLSKAQKGGDPLAYTCIQASWMFVKLASNGAVFTRWAAESKAYEANNQLPKPTLDAEEWTYIRQAVSAAERGIFGLSKEAGKAESGLRDGVWPRKVNGQYEELEVDPQVIDDHRMAIDTVVCIVYIYALLFLVRTGSAVSPSRQLLPTFADQHHPLSFSQGFISHDLVVGAGSYNYTPSSTSPPSQSSPPPSAFTYGGKLHRLLQLGSSFLDAVATNTDHPASKHSILIDQILHLFGTPTLEEQENARDGGGAMEGVAGANAGGSLASLGQLPQQQQAQPNQFVLPPNPNATGSGYVTPSLGTTVAGGVEGQGQAGQDILDMLGDVPDYLYLTQPYIDPNELLHPDSFDGFDWSGIGAGIGFGGGAGTSGGGGNGNLGELSNTAGGPGGNAFFS